MYKVSADPGSQLIRAVASNMSPEEHERFYKDLNQLARRIRARSTYFDLLTDLRNMATRLAEYDQDSIDQLQWLLNNGLRKNAILVTSKIMELQVRRLATESAFKVFASEKEALEWLST